MHKSIKQLHQSLKPSVLIKKDSISIVNSTLFRKKYIDELVQTAVFADNIEVKKEARRIIRFSAAELGTYPASIYNIYKAIGQKKVPPTFTVPALNIRALTYDTARILFSLAKRKKAGPFIFEIARSEIGYTDQRPDEYAICVLAAAIKEGYKGPVFLQGDHYQFSKNKFQSDKDAEIQRIKDLIKESLDAQFYNIDIDASTLVDLEKKEISEQQRTNYEITAKLTEYIRDLEPKDTTVSVGAEIGHIGGKNSTSEELSAFMKGYLRMIKEKKLKGISKISVQTGTSHGGIPLSNGKIADVQLDFNVIKDCGKIAREKYKLAGVVQHGASTLPNVLFGEFPKNKTLEIHLATAFQNIIYGNMPEDLKNQMYRWVEKNLKDEWESNWSKEQFIYKSRKKALGPFKKNLWMLSESDKRPIFNHLRKQFSFLFEKLNILSNKHIVDNYV